MTAIGPNLDRTSIIALLAGTWSKTKGMKTVNDNPMDIIRQRLRARQLAEHERLEREAETLIRCGYTLDELAVVGTMPGWCRKWQVQPRSMSEKR